MLAAMHLCFVDESGTPRKPSGGQSRYFVMAGLVVPEERWHLAANRLQGVKTRLDFKGELKWRFFAPGNNDADNPMAAWPQEKRNIVRSEAFSIITRDRSIKIVAAVCDAVAAYELSTIQTKKTSISERTK